MSAPSTLATRLPVYAALLVTLPFFAQVSAPKVPFGNAPCASLSAADEAALKMSTPVEAKADRAPAKLAADNFCTYTHGGTRLSQIGYMTQLDYQSNSTGNRSKSRQAPSDLPGAFYDGQGGLWMAKNGYYVVISGKSELREPVARIVVKKL